MRANIEKLGNPGKGEGGKLASCVHAKNLSLLYSCLRALFQVLWAGEPTGEAFLSPPPTLSRGGDPEYCPVDWKIAK